ncbi:MAG TPA: phosphopentomutase [Ktedonobacteraceae bacterium]|jgi:phosphopentomutase|nr:phosphopentomutase [Ktedonobacteraceae bacterium]
MLKNSELKQKKKALLLVLDGLGVGVMPDAPAQQKGANTVCHIVSPEQQAQFPMLQRLGLFHVAESGRTSSTATIAGLGYPGADSYLGHNEILGGHAPDTQPDTVQSRFSAIVTALEQANYTVLPLSDNRALWVNGGVLLSDNLENEPGMAINLAGTLDVVDMETLVSMAEVVRAQVRNPRVIAFATPEMSPAAILSAVHTTPEGLTGIDTPAVGFYKEGYQVRHLGVGFDAHQELPHLLVQKGYPVELIGKFADVAAWSDDAIPRRPIVDTAAVLEDTARTWQHLSQGLIAANVQETDLAGHAQDVARSFQVLHMVDAWLQDFLPTLDAQCLFVLTADHGNDPTYGPHHTREYAPVLTWGPLPYALQPMSDLRGVAQLLYTFFEK